MGKRRYLCIYLPAWAANLKRSICVNAPGKEPDAAFVFKALYGLALWALKFSPFAGLDRELTGAFRARALESCSTLHHGLTLDISGTERLYKSEANLHALIRNEFVKSAIEEVRIASAPTICAAWALSRYGQDGSCVVEQEELFRAVSVLPVESLRISTESVVLLRELGIERIAELLRLPPADLNIRFGPLVVRRIEEMLGHRQEILQAVRRPEAFISRRKFETPLLRHEAVRIALLGAFDELLSRLKRRGRRAGSFRIDFNLYSETLGHFNCSREIALHFAVQSFSGIAPAVDAALESLKVNGVIQSFEVRAAGLEKCGAEQAVFISTQQTKPAAREAGELMNNLVLRIGSSRIREASFKSSHIPEKSFVYQSIDSEEPAQAASAAILDRPASFFNPPQPLKALSLLPDYAPSRIHWNGEELKIIKSEGPEKIGEEWWFSPFCTETSEVREVPWSIGSEMARRASLQKGENAPPSPENLQGAGEGRHRCYYKLQDHTGRILWIFRDESMHWFVQGVYA